MLQQNPGKININGWSHRLRAGNSRLKKYAGCLVVFIPSGRKTDRYLVNSNFEICVAYFRLKEICRPVKEDSQ